MAAGQGNEMRHLIPNHGVSEYHDNNNSSSSAEIANWIEKNFSAANIHGTINFHEVTRKSLANFIKLSSTDIDGKFDDIYKLMTEIWKVPSPQLIVSVTGGAKNFDIDNEVLTNFKEIIRKISQTPGAWVITSGTHTGVMKHVGDALREESTAVCVGIPTWGIIEDRIKLSSIKLSSNPSDSRMFAYHVGAWLKAEGAYLDPNHTPFLLYDDGTEDKYGREIEFRANFEDHIVKTKKIPYLLIAVNGGPGTFNTICETIARGHKVILVKESGGVADLIAHLIEGDEIYLKSQNSLIQNLKNRLKDRFDTEWERCKSNTASFVIAQKEGVQSINDVVINEILSVDQKGAVIPTADYLRLALLWHNPGILTKMIPLNKPGIFSNEQKGENSMGKLVRFSDLERLMVMALARGDVAFVKLLLLDYEVDIQDVLTMDVLRTLYGYQSHEKNFPKAFADLKDKDYIDMSTLQEDRRKHVQEMYYWNPNKKIAGGKNFILTNKAICNLRQKFVGLKEIKEPCSKGCNGNDRRWYWCVDPGDENSAVMCDPIWELFIWSSFCNLPDMAKFFWAFEGNQIAKSLIACNFWGKLAKGDRYSEQELELFRKSAGEFDALAYALLNECYKIDEQHAATLVTTTLDVVPGKSCLNLAVEFDNHDFVAHSCVQNVLTDAWTGRLKKKEMIETKDYLGLLFAICLPFLINGNYEFHSDKAKGDEKAKGKSCSNIKSFYFNTPVVGFIFHVVFYILFLILYSHVILHDRVRDRKVPEANSTFLQNSTNKTSANATVPNVNSTNSEDIHIFTMQILLSLFVLGHLTTEIYQITHYGGETVKRKLKSWASDKYSHNLWDTFNLLLFIIAVSLRFYDATQDVGHTLLAVNCMCWIIRLTTALRVHPQFGQYYEMVCLMLADLINFVIMLSFMVLAYGVFSTAVLYPGSTSKQHSKFISIVLKPWFYIYGQYFLNEPDDKETTFGTYRLNSYDGYIVWIFMGIYVGITNILLLNIIIAVFNNTYEEVKNKGKKIWRFNRYHLIDEYLKRVQSPPPFCIIQHLYLTIRWLFSKCCKKCCPKPRVKNKKHLSQKLSCPVVKQDRSTFDEEEQVKLSQFECDRAMYIHKCNMDFEEGKVIIKWLENDKNETNVTGGLEKNLKEIQKKIETSTKVTEGLEQNIKDIKSKMEISTVVTKGLEQSIEEIKSKNSTNVTSEGLEANTKGILENIQKMLEKNMQDIKSEIGNLKESVAEMKGTK